MFSDMLFCYKMSYNVYGADANGLDELKVPFVGFASMVRLRSQDDKTPQTW